MTTPAPVAPEVHTVNFDSVASRWGSAFREISKTDIPAPSRQQLEAAPAVVICDYDSNEDYEDEGCCEDGVDLAPYRDYDVEDSDDEGSLPETGFVSRPLMDAISEAAARPDPRQLWHELWHEGELACLFADTNMGKSVLAMQIADKISAERPVIYIDFEMSDKQLQLRYTDPETKQIYAFSPNLHRLTVNPALFRPDDLDTLLHDIDVESRRSRANVIIIDNITWLSNGCEKGDVAGELMRKLVEMRSYRTMSILVLAHTPKRNLVSELTQNSLAGSKRLANFFDSVFAIGRDYRNPGPGRYIKQIKTRVTAEIYGADHVMVCEMRRADGALRFVLDSYATEYECLEPGLKAQGDEEGGGKPVRMGRPSTVTPEQVEVIRRMQRQGSTYAEMSRQTGLNHRVIARYVKNHASELAPPAATPAQVQEILAASPLGRQVLERRP